MHFEILVEDQSGGKALEILMPKILGEEHTFNIHAYKGIGRIPKNLKGASNLAGQTLLDKLPRLLQAYGHTFVQSDAHSSSAVIVVCDLDDECLKTFRQSLLDVLDQCDPAPTTRFCFAVEEGEAWFLGDEAAILAAYPKARKRALLGYAQDSICGTWEKLADALYPGGHEKLSEQGWQAVGQEKFMWAERITPHMDVEKNASPSFNYFSGKLRELAGMASSGRS